MKKTIIYATAILYSFNSFSWDGYDYGRGSYIEIGSGNLVRPGREIEIYDYGSNQYKYVDVESINSYGNTVEVEVYDYNDGLYRTFEMDR